MFVASYWKNNFVHISQSFHQSPYWAPYYQQHQNGEGPHLNSIDRREPLRLGNLPTSEPARLVDPGHQEVQFACKHGKLPDCRELFSVASSFRYISPQKLVAVGVLHAFILPGLGGGIGNEKQSCAQLEKLIPAWVSPEKSYYFSSIDLGWLGWIDVGKGWVESHVLLLLIQTFAGMIETAWGLRKNL